MNGCIQHALDASIANRWWTSDPGAHATKVSTRRIARRCSSSLACSLQIPCRWPAARLGPQLAQLLHEVERQDCAVLLADGVAQHSQTSQTSQFLLCLCDRCAAAKLMHTSYPHKLQVTYLRIVANTPWGSRGVGPTQSCHCPGLAWLLACAKPKLASKSPLCTGLRSVGRTRNLQLACEDTPVA